MSGGRAPWVCASFHLNEQQSAGGLPLRFTSPSPVLQVHEREAAKENVVRQRVYSSGCSRSLARVGGAGAATGRHSGRGESAAACRGRATVSQGLAQNNSERSSQAAGRASRSGDSAVSSAPLAAAASAACCGVRAPSPGEGCTRLNVTQEL